MCAGPEREVSENILTADSCDPEPPAGARHSPQAGEGALSRHQQGGQHSQICAVFHAGDEAVPGIKIVFNKILVTKLQTFVQLGQGQGSLHWKTRAKS